MEPTLHIDRIRLLQIIEAELALPLKGSDPNPLLPTSEFENEQVLAFMPSAVDPHVPVATLETSDMFCSDGLNLVVKVCIHSEDEDGNTIPDEDDDGVVMTLPDAKALLRFLVPLIGL